MRAVFHVPDRDAPTVVVNRDRAVAVQCGFDAVTVSGHCLIDGVVDDLPDEVVEPRNPDASRPQIHEGPGPDMAEATEGLNLFGFVCVVGVHFNG